jgi:predicted enzyme related to lactoylglutathione lyase
MQANEFVPLFSTEKIGESKDFYTRHLGFEVDYEEPGYVQLRLGGEGGAAVAFMQPDEEYGGTGRGPGLLYCFQVDDVDAEHERLAQHALPDLSPPEDKPWGGRCATLTDPNGIAVLLFTPLAGAQPAS